MVSGNGSALELRAGDSTWDFGLWQPEDGPVFTESVAIRLATTPAAGHEVPENGTGWATLAPLLVGGLGAGLVISPNQTLTLSEVPVERAGTAGGLLQVGQRIGAAVGIAAVGSVFFARVASSRGDFASAFQHGILVATAFIVAALVLAVVDVVVDRRVNAAGQKVSPAP